MLRVFCVDTELDEYGEVIEVGQRVSRLASRQPGTYFGTSLDEVEWGLDSYAEVGREGAAVVSGRVVELHAVYVRLTRHGYGGWTAARGTASLEPVWSTAATRRPVRRPDRDVVEGEKSLSGWLIALEDERFDAPRIDAADR